MSIFKCLITRTNSNKIPFPTFTLLNSTSCKLLGNKDSFKDINPGFLLFHWCPRMHWYTKPSYKSFKGRPWYPLISVSTGRFQNRIPTSQKWNPQWIPRAYCMPLACKEPNFNWTSEKSIVLQQPSVMEVLWARMFLDEAASILIMSRLEAHPITLLTSLCFHCPSLYISGFIHHCLVAFLLRETFLKYVLLHWLYCRPK